MLILWMVVSRTQFGHHSTMPWLGSYGQGKKPRGALSHQLLIACTLNDLIIRGGHVPGN